MSRVVWIAQSFGHNNWMINTSLGINTEMREYIVENLFLESKYDIDEKKNTQKGMSHRNEEI